MNSGLILSTALDSSGSFWLVVLIYFVLQPKFTVGDVAVITAARDFDAAVISVTVTYCLARLDMSGRRKALHLTNLELLGLKTDS